MSLVKDKNSFPALESHEPSVTTALIHILGILQVLLKDSKFVFI